MPISHGELRGFVASLSSFGSPARSKETLSSSPAASEKYKVCIQCASSSTWICHAPPSSLSVSLTLPILRIFKDPRSSW